MIEGKDIDWSKVMSGLRLRVVCRQILNSRFINGMGEKSECRFVSNTNYTNNSILIMNTDGYVNIIRAKDIAVDLHDVKDCYNTIWLEVGDTVNRSDMNCDITRVVTSTKGGNIKYNRYNNSGILITTDSTRHISSVTLAQPHKLRLKDTNVDNHTPISTITNKSTPVPQWLLDIENSNDTASDNDTAITNSVPNIIKVTNLDQAKLFTTSRDSVTLDDVGCRVLCNDTLIWVCDRNDVGGISWKTKPSNMIFSLYRNMIKGGARGHNIESNDSIQYISTVIKTGTVSNNRNVNGSVPFISKVIAPMPINKQPAKPTEYPTITHVVSGVHVIINKLYCTDDTQYTTSVGDVGKLVLSNGLTIWVCDTMDVGRKINYRISTKIFNAYTKYISTHRNVEAERNSTIVTIATIATIDTGTDKASLHGYTQHTLHEGYSGKVKSDLPFAVKDL